MGGRVLMVSHIMPCPPAAGNEQHIFRMLRWLREEGYDVIFVLRPCSAPAASHLAQLRSMVYRLHVVPDTTAWRGHRERWRQRVMRRCDTVVNKLERHDLGAPRFLRRGRLEHLEDTICPPSFAEQVGVWSRQYRPFAIIAQYVFMTRCFAHVDPSLLRIVDTHDMYSTRKEKVCSHGIEDPLIINGEEEATLLRRADVVMTAQEDEAIAMRALGLDQRVFTIAIDMDLPKLDGLPAEVPEQLLIVASDNQPNVLGVRGFLSRAWPTIRERHPQATLRIVGKVARHFSEAVPGVTFSGFLPSLTTAYAEAQIAINPVYAGSGLKIKSVEALAHGKPLVSWPIGMDGMGSLQALPCLSAGHWVQFADRIDELLANPALRVELSQRALRYIEERYTRDVIYRQLGEVLRQRSPL